MTEGTDADDVAAAIAAELQLMTPRVRASRELAGQLLDPEFVEVGASGRRWDREAMLAALPAMPGGPGHAPVELRGTVLAPGLVHLTYEVTVDGKRSRRSSIWRKRDEHPGWGMYYHQGTPVPPGLESGAG